MKAGGKTREKSKKAQGMPIHVIVVIVLGIIILAAVLLYVFGVFGEASGSANNIFNIGGNVSENATDTAQNVLS